MVRPEQRFADGLTAVLEYLSMAGITVMALLVIAQVILRYVFNDPLTWSEEMARIFFVASLSWGGGAPPPPRRHMAIDALVILLPPRAKRIAEFVVVGIASAFLIAVIAITARSIMELYRMEVTTPALEFPMAFVYLVIPFGLAALIVQMWLDLYKDRRPS